MLVLAADKILSTIIIWNNELTWSSFYSKFKRKTVVFKSDLLGLPMASNKADLIFKGP